MFMWDRMVLGFLTVYVDAPKFWFAAVAAKRPNQLHAIEVIPLQTEGLQQERDNTYSFAKQQASCLSSSKRLLFQV